MDGEIQRQAYAEIASIHRILETVVFPGRESQWNGNILVEKQDIWLGFAHFEGYIGLNQDLLASEDSMPLMRATIIHEMLHMFSKGYEKRFYSRFIGWEEGVAEKLQRLLRPQILYQLGYEDTDSFLFEREENHMYAPYIFALEAVRNLVEQEEQVFYYDLHSLPLSERPFEILKLIRAKHDRRVVDAYMNVNDVLCTNITKPVELVRF